jgi:hypothetical protein
MKELKRLSTGLLSALMVLTLILAPIPQTSRAWAESRKEKKKQERLDKRYSDCSESDLTQAEGGVYKAGCDFEKYTLKDVTLDRSDKYHDSKIKSIIEQYIVGLFGLVLINGMRWDYLYKYKPLTYGMDCPTNEGAKMSMPIAQIAALTSIIGDAQANVRFKEASAKAVDDAFAIKGKAYVPSEDSEEYEKWKEEGKAKGEIDPITKANLENEKQLLAYDKLEDIIEEQLKAVKAKRNWSRVASVGYYGAEAVELANIYTNTMNCSKSRKTAEIESSKAKAEFTTAIAKAAKAAVSTECTNVTAAAVSLQCSACGTLSALLGKLKAKYLKDEVQGEANGAALLGKRMKDNVKLLDVLKELFSGIKTWFRPGSGVDVDKVVTDTAKDLTEQSVQELTDNVEMKKILSEAVGKSSGDAASIAAITAALQTCRMLSEGVTAADEAEEAVVNFVKWSTIRVTCCGGPGVTKAAQESFENTMGGTCTSFTEYLDLKQNMIKQQGKCAQNPLGAAAGCGSYVFNGVPQKSVFHKTKDIAVLGLFEKADKSGASLFENPEALDQMYVKNEFSKIILRSGLEHMLLRLQTPEQMKDPQKALKQIAHNSKVIDELMDYYDREVADNFNALIAQEEWVYTEKLKKFVSKIMNELLIPQAQANSLGGAAGAVVGSMLLGYVGNQVQNPWLKEIFNLGQRLMMLQGLLGKVAKEYALVSPMGRSFTWALIAVTNEFVINFLKDTKEVIEKNLELVRAEKQRFYDSAASNSNLATSKSHGGSQLNLQKYDPTAARNNAMNIKACAIPKGDGFAPAMCPAVIPKQKFTLPDVSGRVGNHLTPDFLKGMSLLSDMSYAAASGSLSGDSMSDSQLAQIDSLNKAMAAHNSKLRDQVDAHNAGIKTKDGLSSPPLQKLLNDFKRDLGSGGGGASDLGLGGSPVASASPRLNPRADDGEKVIEGTGSRAEGTSGGGAPLAKTPNLDLDFGDEAGGVKNMDEASEGAVTAKGEEKLEDFVLNHDDIDKRSEVPIWKILSNRYILSYPKILEEEKAEPTQQ